VVKGRARAISPLVIVAWTQAVAFLGWATFFALTGHVLVWPGRAWLAIAASVVLVTGMSGLIARASARGDLSVVGPVYALSPIFTVVPDAVLSGTLPSPLGFVGIALAVAGTVGLSRGSTSGGTLRQLFRRPDALDALLAAIFLGMLSAVDRWGALALGPPSYLVCSHGATALLNLGLTAVRAPRALHASVLPQNVVTLLAHGLLGLTGTAMQTYGQKLTDQQEVLMSAADILIDVFAAESALLRAAATPTGSVHEAAAQVYVADAAGRVEIAARTTLAAIAEGDMLRTLLAALRRVMKVTPVNTVALRRRVADAVIERKAYPF